MAQENV